jgi:LysM repeat protein
LEAEDRIRHQTGQKERFKQGLERSTMYLDTIAAILKQHGVPDELKYLPHVESSFNYDAYSKVGAAGLWQFMRSTGRGYMRVDYMIDERSDPIISTYAAAKFLRANYDLLQAWPIAVTAYNHGPNGMRRAVETVGSRDIADILVLHESSSFKFASKNFYSCFVAVLQIMEKPEKYFKNIQYKPRFRATNVAVPAAITPKALCGILDIPEDEFKRLNPSFRPAMFQQQKAIPAGYRVNIPESFSMDDALAALKTKAPPPPPPAPAKPAPAVAAKGKAADKTSADKPAAEKPVAVRSIDADDGYYTVVRGDNLHSIARRLGVQMNDLAAANNITNSSRIYIGQVLLIPTSEPAPVPVADKTTPAPEPVAIAQSVPPPLVSAVPKPEAVPTPPPVPQPSVPPTPPTPIPAPPSIQAAIIEDKAPPSALSSQSLMPPPTSTDKKDAPVPPPSKAKARPTRGDIRIAIESAGITINSALADIAAAEASIAAIEAALAAAAVSAAVPKPALPEPAAVIDPAVSKPVPRPAAAKADPPPAAPAITPAPAPDTLSPAAAFRVADAEPATITGPGGKPSPDTRFDANVYDLKITLSANGQTARARVTVDETVGHFADWSRVNNEDIRQLNNMTPADKLHLGGRITFPVKSPDHLKHFETARLQYHLAIEEDFFAGYYVTDFDQKKIRSGENLRRVCRDAQIPMWLLKKYNKHVDFYSPTKAGDKLWIPRIAAKDSSLDASYDFETTVSESDTE